MNQIIKNTIILFVITLVAGICLGTVHDITLDPIAQAQEAAATKTYQEVYPDAASFDEPQELADAVTAAADSISEWGFGKVTINDAKEALDASGNQIGYLITSTSAESYGGNVQIIRLKPSVVQRSLPRQSPTRQMQLSISWLTAWHSRRWKDYE